MRNVPLYSMVTTGILVVAAVLLVIFGDPDKQGFMILLGLIVTTVPSVVSAIYSERASRDIRNGVVVDKVREGASQAIEDAQVITRTGPVVTTELSALSTLLERIQNATDNSNNKSEGGAENGRPTV